MNTKQDYSWETTHSIGYMSHHFGNGVLINTSFTLKKIGLFKSGERIALYELEDYSKLEDYTSLLCRTAKEAAQIRHLTN